MTYRAVLFDMDGVILDSEPLHVAAFQAVLKRYGHTLTDDDYKAHFAGKTDEEGFKQYFAFISETTDLPQIMDTKTRTYLKLAGDQLVPYPGVVAIIKKLATKLPLALVTGSLKAEAEVALQACGIEDCFTVIVTADDITHSKPNPQGYLKAADLLHVPPKECVAIEDSPSGIKAALAAGMDCIAVTNTHSSDELRAATKTVDSLSPELFHQ